MRCLLTPVGPAFLIRVILSVLHLAGPGSSCAQERKTLGLSKVPFALGDRSKFISRMGFCHFKDGGFFAKGSRRPLGWIRRDAPQ